MIEICEFGRQVGRQSKSSFVKMANTTMLMKLTLFGQQLTTPIYLHFSYNAHTNNIGLTGNP